MSFAEGVPTVEIVLGRKSYTLGWTWGAKRRLNELLKTQGADLTDQAAIGQNLAAVLWSSLDKEGRLAISVEDLEEMIHPGNELDVATKIGELFKVSEPEPDPNADPPAVKKPTGGQSTSINSARLESVT